MMVKKHAKSALLIAVCLCAGILNNGIVYALDYTFYTSNGILYYDPDAPTCNDTTTPTGSNVEIVSNENAEAILTVLTKQGGFSLAASAGIVGNLMMESSLNPAKIQGGAIAPDNVNILSLKYDNGDQKGFGLAQWTDAGRKQNLINYAKQQNAKITDLAMQVGFLLHEMDSPSYKYMVNKLNDNKDDPVAAAAVFHGLTPNIEREGSGMNPTFAAAGAKYGFERSGDTSDQVIKNRGGAAKAVYDKYKGTIQDGSGATVGDVNGQSSTGTTQGCQSGDSSNSDGTEQLTPGSGKFQDNGEVKNWQTVLHNAQATDRLFGNRMEGDGWCASIVSRVWHGADVGYGVNYAITLWDQNKSNGIGHADRKPKKGAILIYRSAHQSAGHVTIYLGQNNILNDGKIRPASYVEAGGWGEIYQGWIDPNDLGWTSKSASDGTLNAIFNNSKYLVR